MESAKLLKSDPRARPKPFTFRPPKSNRAVIAFTKSMIRGAIRRKLKVTQIDIDDRDLEKLRALKGKRCLLTPSHSGGFEPHIVIYLSKLLGDDYNYVAAMEAFEKSFFTGWVMQRLGAYSIIRGAADRPSFLMTKQLLVDAQRWLVIFPEGQTVWQNGTVMPFQEGVVSIAFKALGEVAKNEEDPQLYCVPIAIRYVYLQDMHAEMEASLARLEASLFPSDQDRPATAYQRLRRIGEAVLVANEKRYNVDAQQDASLNDRIQAMKQWVVARMEQQLEMTPNAGEELLDRIRALFNHVDRICQEESEVSGYERQLISKRQEEVQTLYDDLWRVLQLVAIYDGYVSESLTMERFMDVLCLLEMEVFNERRIWGPRKAHVRVGDPIDLEDHRSAYRDDKRATVTQTTLALESSVRQMLNAMEADCATV